MSPRVPPASGRARRAAPNLVLTPRPRGAELVAALALVAVLVQLLFAQLTLALTVIFVVTGKLGRWRLSWLTAPASVGLVWAAAISFARAAEGFVAGPAQVWAYLAGDPARIVRLADAFTGASGWLPRQLPVALLAAAAETALVLQLQRTRLLRSGTEPPASRPGAIVAARRRLTAAGLSAGQVVTRDGWALGLDTESGRRADVRWSEAEAGLLAFGADPAALTQATFPAALAAVRRRKAVLVIDLTGSEWLATSLAAACHAAAAPLSRFSPGGPGWYEPLRSHPPGAGAALVSELVDWARAGEQHRHAAERYLTEALTVLAATAGTAGRGNAAGGSPLPGRPGGEGQPGAASGSPVPGRPDGTPPGAAGPPSLFDQLAELLAPSALQARLALVPAYYPRRAELARRTATATELFEAAPAVGAELRARLTALRESGIGRWLEPPPAGRGGAISVGGAVRERAVVLFSLDQHGSGEPAQMTARLALADLLAVLRSLRDLSLRTDCLIWINGCEAIDSRALGELIAFGPASGTSVLVTTARPAVAAALVSVFRVAVLHGPADPALAGLAASSAAPWLVPALWSQPGQPATAGWPAAGPQQAPLTSQQPTPAGAAGLAGGSAFWLESGQAGLAELLVRQDADRFAMLARGRGNRVLPYCQTVPVLSGEGR